MKIFVDGSKRAAINRMFPVWKKKGHVLCKDPKIADIQLSSVVVRNKIKIPTILRIDGIYYDKGSDFKSMNRKISASHEIADGIVYQSHFSQKMCEKYLSERKTDIYKVIYNGIDPSFWCGSKIHNSINIVSCGKWRRPKRLKELIQIFKKFLKIYPDAKLHIIGPMSRGTIEIPCKNVIYYGQINYVKMREIYKEMDLYIHLCKKDSCPSSVIEAIASGIPVITTNACGGATEICRMTKECIVVNGESESLEPDYIYRDLYNKISNKIESHILKSMSFIIENGIRVILPSVLNIQNTAEQYLSIMEEVLEKNRKKKNS